MDPSRRPAITPVELVCALVVLGVLGAIAVPRYFDIVAAEHRNAVDATARKFRSALIQANVACVLQGWAGRDDLPGFADGGVDFNSACYPTDTTGNVNVIGNSTTRCVRVWGTIFPVVPSITIAATGADYRALASGQTCTYRYLQDVSTVRGFTYDAASGVIVVTNP